ncbi:MAG: type II secretion system F family protein [Leptospiraceae bacterium]|nr:type II secretion system F family protein [Leptospiraceae bacterium]
MAIYSYIAVNRKGKEEKGIIDAANPAAARGQLRKQGLFVRSLTEDREKVERELFPGLTKFLYRVPRKSVGLFVRQLGTLLQAGLPLDRSLATIIEQIDNDYLKKALIEIKADVTEGEALSDSLKKHDAIFPEVYHNLIAVGERTGNYEKALLRLADLEDANEALKNKITTAMAYPFIMVLLLTGIVGFLLAVVFPKMQKLFNQVGADLPLITKIVIGVSNFITSPWILVLFGAIGVLTFFFQRWKKTDAGRRQFEQFILMQPLAGSVNRKVLMARFARNLGVMLTNRVPLLASLQVVSRIVNHAVFADEIQAAMERIKEGSRLTDAFKGSVILNQMILGMMNAGELSDQVPEMVERIADILDDEIDSTVQKLSQLLEPVMIVVMGGIIVVIMLAIMLPMYSLTQQLQ